MRGTKGTPRKRYLHILCLILFSNIISFANPTSPHESDIPDSRSFVPGELLVQVKTTPTTIKSIHTNTASSYKLPDRLKQLRVRYGLTETKVQPTSSNQQSIWRRYQTDRNVNEVCKILRQDPDVVSAQPNYRYKICRTPNDPEFPDQYAHQLIYMEDAWDISIGSRDIVVAVLDTGVDVNHPDLKDNIWINPNEIPDNDIDDDNNGYIDDLHGWNFEDDDNQVNPTVGLGYWYDNVLTHGTMVSGVIAGTGNNDIGVTGVNWQCSIMALRLSLEFTSAEVAAGIKYAAANGAHVLNMSFGADEFGPEGDPIVQEAIETAYKAGVFLIASAGNSDTSRPNYPAAYPSVMAVSSTDGEDMKTGHSSFGPWVDIAAPGTDIVTTTFDDDYIATAGTSFSSPYVGAVAALVMAADPNLTALDVRAILENTVDDVFYGEVDANYGYIGTGRVNAYTALQSINEELPLGEIYSPRHNQTFTPLQESIPVELLIHGQSYSLAYRIVGEEDWIDITSSVADVPNANIPLSLPNPGVGVYELQLTVTTNEHIHRDTKHFGIESAKAQTHWPKPLKAVFPPDQIYYGHPLCLDITGDGHRKIMQGGIDIYTYESLINVWDADGNNIPGWPLVFDNLFFPTFKSIGDIDGDGDFELILADDLGGELQAFHLDDQQPVQGDWPVIPGGWGSNIIAPPTLADLDGDGDSEILVALDYTSSNSDGLHAIQHDGSFLWQRRYSTEGPMSVADIDGDGDIEIALSGYGPGISNLYTFLLDHNAKLIKKWKGGSHMGTIIADMDGDDTSEIIFCYEDGVQAVQANGKTLWKSRVYGPFSEIGSLSVGDVDSNGKKELYVNAYVEADGYAYAMLYAFDHRGKLLFQTGYPKILMGSPLYCPPLIADIDGDGQKEIMAAAAGAPLMAWEADGSSSPGFPMLNLVPMLEGPVTEDVDQDGDLEILMGLDDYRFAVVDLPEKTDRALMDWVNPYHDPQNSCWVMQAPSLKAINVPEQVTPGQKLNVTLEVINPTETPYHIFVGNLPPGAHYDPNTTTLLWKPTQDQAFQTYRLSFLVTNGVHQHSQLAEITVVPNAIYAINMNEDSNWQLDTGWAWGQPQGLGSWNGDPNSAYTGDNVIGFNLKGDYANNQSSPRYATLGPIDCSGHETIRLSFWRWLGIEAPYDQANIQVSNDGNTWTNIWTSGQSHISDTSWRLVELTVPSELGDNQSTLYFRWGLGPTDETVTYPGWNIDDVQVTGTIIE